MSHTPTILLAFANSAANHLDLLKAEGEALKNALRPLEQRNFIRVEKEESTTTGKLTKALAEDGRRLLVFHYGGHAGADLLQLEDRSAQAKGLAKLLGELPELKLVFLNGCSTKEQVKLLLDAGVKAVIATSVEVNDEKAKRFATTFYQALANKRTIQRAFDFARAAMETEFRDAPAVQVFRSFNFTADSTGWKEAMPWGLYVLPKFEADVLHWHLPYYAKQGLPDKMVVYIDEQFDVNRDIALVLEEMCRYNPDLYHKMVEVRDGMEKRKDSSTFLDLVIENFPWVIGSQLRLLLIHNRLNRDRLEQLLSTYLVTVKVLYFILLANLWQEVFSMGNKEKKKTTTGFAEENSLNEANALDYDFLAGIGKLHQRLQTIGGQLFAPEFERLCSELETDGPLRDAHLYLEALQHRYRKLADSELERECYDAEEAVSIILKHAAFLANYHLLTVRNIKIDNPPFDPEAYEIDLGRLNAVVNTSLRLYDDSEYRRKDTYSNSQSIILVPSEDDFRTFLNLSPFIIDKNTFLNNSAIDLFLYAFEREECYYYLAVNHSMYQAMENEKGTDIIHTGMTDVDFQEGRNIRRKTSRRKARFGSDTRIRAAHSIVKGHSVFGPLERQFERFKSDFGFI